MNVIILNLQILVLNTLLEANNSCTKIIVVVVQMSVYEIDFNKQFSYGCHKWVKNLYSIENKELRIRTCMIQALELQKIFRAKDYKNYERKSRIIEGILLGFVANREYKINHNFITKIELTNLDKEKHLKIFSCIDNNILNNHIIGAKNTFIELIKILMSYDINTSYFISLPLYKFSNILYDWLAGISVIFSSGCWS